MAKDQSRIPLGLPTFDFGAVTDEWASAQPMLDFDPFRRSIESQAQMNTRLYGSSNPTVAADTNTKTVPGSFGTIAEGSASLGDTLSSWFVRGVVIILGFIFVAVGLSMFKVPAAQQVIQTVKPK